jgi:hypothetical protein
MKRVIFLWSLVFAVALVGSAFAGQSTDILSHKLYAGEELQKAVYSPDLDPPPNDDCENATAIYGDIDSLAYTTVEATTDAPACGNYADLNIWYCWEPNEDGVAFFSLCGSQFDTKLAVYDDCDCEICTLIASNDDYCGLQSQIDEIPCVEGEPILVEVGGYGNQSGAGILTIWIETGAPDLVLLNLMKKVYIETPYVPGTGQFDVELLVDNVGFSPGPGSIDVYVLCGADSQHVTTAYTFNPGPQFIVVGPFDLCDACEDMVIHAYVDLDPPLVDPTPENNVYEIYNVVPCLCLDTIQYDNGTVTNGIAYYAYQQGAAFMNDTGFPWLCGFQLGLTDVGNGGPLYVYVWVDNDGDVIPDEVIYTGHYFFQDIPQWPDFALYQGPLCIETNPQTYYWIMVAQKHYDDLGMLSYVCIDDNWDYPHSQWYYDGSAWYQGWGYNGDSWVRACVGGELPDYDLTAGLEIVSPIVPSVNGNLLFDLSVMNTGANTFPTVIGRMWPRIGDCVQGNRANIHVNQTITQNLPSMATFMGHYFYNVGNVSRFNLDLCSIDIEVGDNDTTYDTVCDEFNFFNPWARSSGPSGWGTEWLTRDQLDSNVPSVTTLGQNYPNPFNATTTIPFDLSTDARVSLKIYNLAGQLVETLVNGQMNAGHHTVDWDASSVSSGVYFYKLQVGDYVTTQKMNLLK